MSWIREQPAIGAIGQQIQLLQHGLAEKHFIAQDQGFLQGVPAKDLKNDWLTDADNFFSPIRVLGESLAADTQA